MSRHPGAWTALSWVNRLFDPLFGHISYGTQICDLSRGFVYHFIIECQDVFIEVPTLFRLHFEEAHLVQEIVQDTSCLSWMDFLQVLLGHVQ